MANPSSTSSKRLVGLGLRGMRNSAQAPPTQVTAQIKSALAQSSPRTSPTVNTGTVTTTATPGGLTRTTTTSPSATSMRTSPSMMTITSFAHPGIRGGNTTMARTPTSPVGLKTLGVRGSATTTSPTMTSPFGTPTSTPFVTPNTSPQMLANAGRIGSLNVAGGVEGGTGSGTKVELVNASTKSPLGEFCHTAEEYFGPMKRLEEIVNEISEEMREGGSSSHTEPPRSSELPMFFDVPFPLRPDKTFRIHSSPTTLNEWVTEGGSDAIPQRPLAPSGRVVSNAADAVVGSSTRSPAAESDQISVNALSTPNHTRSEDFLERFINSPQSPSSSAERRKVRFSPLPSPSELSYSPRHRLPVTSPRSSLGSRYSRMSGDSVVDCHPLAATAKSKSNMEGRWVSSPPPSPSSSLSRWLREENDDHNNYSMICSPGESPLLASEGGRRVRGGGEVVSASTSLESCSSAGSRKRSGFNSPVAKIETVLGPRERGVGCIPEKRDYHSLYSRLRSPSMSAGSLTPLEENESMDFGFGDGDDIFNNDPSPTSPLPSPSLPTSSQIPGMPVITSSDNTVVVANAAVGILSGAGAGSSSGAGAGSGSGGPAASVVTATAPAPAPRLGLRRKSTGVGSPLVNVVATYDSIKSEQDKVEGGKQMEGSKEGGEDELDCYGGGGGGGGDTPMSPVLMRTKDSLLLKDAQRQKIRRDAMENPDFGSDPVLGMGRDMSSGELRSLVDREVKNRGLYSRPISPPFCSSESSRAADMIERPQSSLSPTTQVCVLPDTPTIGPCAMTVEGSKPLVDEAISPLQLSSPILPSGVCL